MAPPLCITAAEVDELARIAAEAISELNDEVLQPSKAIAASA
jgi:adenosylmethionine-8-amino-7-oxononanoate aminotransferase